MYKAKSVRNLTILLQRFQVGIFCFWKKIPKTKRKKKQLRFTVLTNPTYFLAPGENESNV